MSEKEEKEIVLEEMPVRRFELTNMTSNITSQLEAIKKKTHLLGDLRTMKELTCQECGKAEYMFIVVKKRSKHNPFDSSISYTDYRICLSCVIKEAIRELFGEVFEEE